MKFFSSLFGNNKKRRKPSPKAKVPKNAMTTYDVVKATGMTYTNVYHHIFVGTLRAAKFGRELFIEKAEYESWIEWITAPRKSFHGREIR